MLNDYLSAIEGYMATKVIQTTKRTNSKIAGIGVEAKFINGDLGKKTNNDLETPKDLSKIVKGPAFVVTPIAIYK